MTVDMKKLTGIEQQLKATGRVHPDDAEWLINEVKRLPGVLDQLIDLRDEAKHRWVDGPDGKLYHCERCHVSKCDDHDFYWTCVSYLDRSRRGLTARITEAVEEETERCVRIAEAFDRRPASSHVELPGKRIADTIRDTPEDGECNICNGTGCSACDARCLPSEESPKGGNRIVSILTDTLGGKQVGMVQVITDSGEVSWTHRPNNKEVAQLILEHKELHDFYLASFEEQECRHQVEKRSEALQSLKSSQWLTDGLAGDWRDLSEESS